MSLGCCGRGVRVLSRVELGRVSRGNILAATWIGRTTGPSFFRSSQEDLKKSQWEIWSR